MHQNFDKAALLLQELLLKISGPHNGFLSKDIAEYRLFFFDVGDDGPYSYQPESRPEIMVKDYLRNSPEACDTFDAVPWPFENMVVFTEVAVGAENTITPTIFIPYKRKGSFMVASASLGENGDIYFGNFEYGYGEDIFLFPNFVADDVFTDRSDLSSDQKVAYQIPLRVVITLVENINSCAKGTCYVAVANPTNKKRIAKGKKPLFDWHTVEIKPRVQSAPIDGEKTGIKHRQHEVRGHWCIRKSTGLKYWRKAHKRGDASLGVVFHDYVVTP